MYYGHIEMSLLYTSYTYHIPITYRSLVQLACEANPAWVIRPGRERVQYQSAFHELESGMHDRK